MPSSQPFFGCLLDRSLRPSYNARFAASSLGLVQRLTPTLQLTAPSPRRTYQSLKIIDQLYLGDGKSSRDCKILVEHNITAVVSQSVVPVPLAASLESGHDARHPEVDLRFDHAYVLAPERHGAPFDKPSRSVTDQCLIGPLELVQNARLNELFAFRDQVSEYTK